SSCANNLKQWGLVYKMYTNESAGMRFPTLNAWVQGASLDTALLSAGPRPTSLYPEYLTDLNICFCPSSARQADVSVFEDSEGVVSAQKVNENWWYMDYCYLGWVLDRCGKDVDPDGADASQLLALLSLAGVGYADPPPDLTIPNQVNQTFRTLMDRVLSDIGAYDSLNEGIVAISDLDLPVETPWGNGGGDMVYRLNEGVERFVISNVADASTSAMAQSEIFIMLDIFTSGAADNINYFNHVPGGCNVLYMDGHVEFVKYKSKVPVDDRIATILGALIKN
ncbi:MAG TPA: hypothetical protein ENN80_04415, partial [Candidatus Hydrogenedentes bacterium]|nr:hypothetical protein [Candidatus Hydrogenedentota bacterium]